MKSQKLDDFVGKANILFLCVFVCFFIIYINITNLMMNDEQH
jgi:cell division protein FtsI/penicillin-binding protein 2